MSITTEAKTKVYTFTLMLGGIDELTEEFASSIYSACDDAMCGEYAGRPYVTFDRESESFSTAMVSAIQEVESALGGAARVVEVRPPDIEIVEIANDLLKMRAVNSKRSVAEEMWQILLKSLSGEQPVTH